MMSWVKMIFYFGGMLKAIYTVHWYSFHSFGTCQESFVIVSFEWGIETLIWRREQTIGYDRGCIAACRFSGVWNLHCLCLECHGKGCLQIRSKAYVRWWWLFDRPHLLNIVLQIFWHVQVPSALCRYLQCSRLKGSRNPYDLTWPPK